MYFLSKKNAIATLRTIKFCFNNNEKTEIYTRRLESGCGITRPQKNRETSPCTWNYMISCFFYLSSTETRQSKEFEVPKHRLRKCDENFWTRATRLYNIMRKTTDKPLGKKLLTQMYMTFFHRRYNELDSCSWRVLCNCGNCNPLKNLC